MIKLNFIAATHNAFTYAYSPLKTGFLFSLNADSASNLSLL